MREEIERWKEGRGGGGKDGEMEGRKRREKEEWIEGRNGAGGGGERGGEKEGGR